MSLEVLGGEVWFLFRGNGLGKRIKAAVESRTLFHLQEEWGSRTMSRDSTGI